MTGKAAIFCGGPNAFSLYEPGKIEHYTSTLNQVNLLDRHPELVDEIRGQKTRRLI